MTFQNIEVDATPVPRANFMPALRQKRNAGVSIYLGVAPALRVKSGVFITKENFYGGLTMSDSYGVNEVR